MHVLTLTATPIPRTLQMALTGVRDLSLIATPPVDRLAVRTFIMPFDPVVIREAIAAREVPRRPDLLCRAAHRGSRPHGRRACASWCPRSRIVDGPWPAGAHRAGAR